MLTLLMPSRCSRHPLMVLVSYLYWYMFLVLLGLVEVFIWAIWDLMVSLDLFVIMDPMKFFREFGATATT